MNGETLLVCDGSLVNQLLNWWLIEGKMIARANDNLVKCCLLIGNDGLRVGY